MGCRTELPEVYTFFRVDPKLNPHGQGRKIEIYNTAAYLTGKIRIAPAKKRSWLKN